MLRPTRRALLAVAFVKVGVIGGVCALALGLGAHAGPVDSAGAAAIDTPTPTAARIAQLMAAHDCSTTGFEAGVTPGSAIVERSDGVHYVSFDVGWDTFLQKRPGRLLAVCRDAG